jgi:protocatechuate 3,4-dioxygenase alpha subunit
MSTPSQTIGPFFSHALAWAGGELVVPEGTDGAFWVRGHVYDGAGDPVPDALIETWQADPSGRYGTPGFGGFARCPTDPSGAWGIHTVRPGRVGDQAPHLAVSVFARGLLDRVVTRVYLPEDCAGDPLLARLDEARHATLVARPARTGGYTFDIRLQGADETVFFAV